MKHVESDFTSLGEQILQHFLTRDIRLLMSLEQASWLQCLGPFAFFDVKGTEELTDDLSRVNTLEAELVMELFLALVTRYPELRGRSSSIAIISPYKAQVKLFQI